MVEEHIHESVVVDIGCGVGTWASIAKDKGAKKVYGIDGPWIGEENIQIKKSNFISHNLEEGMEFDKSCDLAICLEVLEHLSDNAGRSVVEWMVNNADTVLFSAAIPGQGGKGHVNEQWQSYWADMFIRGGFEVHDIRDANQGLSASRSIAAASRPKAWTISPSEERTFEAS